MRICQYRVVLFAVVGMWVFVAGCGVRGKPQPPLEPVMIGRGHPELRPTPQPTVLQNPTAEVVPKMPDTNQPAVAPSPAPSPSPKIPRGKAKSR